MEDGKENNARVTKAPFHPKKPASKKTRTAVVLLLAILLVALLIFAVKKPGTDQEPNPAEFKQNLNSIDDKIRSGNLEGSIDELKSAIDKTDDPAYRYQYASRLAANYTEKQEWEEAIYWFEQARATMLPGSENALLDIATLAERIGDNQKAIRNYQELIGLLENRSEPGDQEYIKEFEAKIKQLEKDQ